MNETELGSVVVEWLAAQHWDVYQEVQFFGRGGGADIVAVRAGKVWIIETKTSLTFTVLEQARKWPCHFRSIAVPRSKHTGDRDFAYEIAHRYLSLGILEVGYSEMVQDKTVFEIKPAPLMRDFHDTAKWMIGQLCEEHKYFSKAGSYGGGYYTPYQKTMRYVRSYIQAYPGCTLKQIMDAIPEHHYASTASARSSIRTALETFEKNWCEIRKGERGELRYFIKTGAKEPPVPLLTVDAFVRKNGQDRIC